MRTGHVVIALIVAGVASTAIHAAAPIAESTGSVSMERQYVLTVGAADQQRFRNAVAAAIGVDGMGSTLADLDAASDLVQIKSSIRRRAPSGSDADLRATVAGIGDAIGTAIEVGDRFSYHYCQGDSDRLWRVVYQQADKAAPGRWVLDGYSSRMVKNCASAAASASH